MKVCLTYFHHCSVHDVFSKYWRDGYIGRPPPQTLGDRRPFPHSPLNLRPCLQAQTTYALPYSQGSIVIKEEKGIASEKWGTCTRRVRQIFARIIARFALCFKTFIGLPSQLVLKLRGSITNSGKRVLQRKDVNGRHFSNVPSHATSLHAY